MNSSIAYLYFMPEHTLPGSIPGSLKSESPLAHLPQDVVENEILLSLNRDIVSVSDKSDILQIIHPKLRILFGTDDIFICKIDPSQDLLLPFLRTADKDRTGNDEYEKVLSGRFSTKDRFIHSILDATAPVQFDLDEVCNWPAPPDYAVLSRSCGIRESLSIGLYHGTEPIGVLSFWSDKKNGFTPHHHQLIRKVGDQMSIIVHNILSNEKIREKEKELEILLTVSHAIASIRDKNDLVEVIQKTLRSFIQYSDIAITRFNLAKQTFRVFLDYCEKTSQHPDFNTIAYAEYPIADGIHDRIMNAEEAVVLQVKQLVKEGMVHISFLEQAGIKELAGIRLRHNNMVIGTMVLLSDQEHVFTPATRRLIKEVSQHFATAMVNIIYHQEIEERSRENEILLSISSAFSSIRDKEQLLPALTRQLENLSFYSDVTIAIVDPNGKTFSGYLVNEHVNRVGDKTYPQMRAAHHPFPDGVFETALHAKRPIIFDVEEMGKQDHAPSYIKFLYNHGTVDMVGVSLRDRNNEIGVLFLFSDKKQVFSDLQMSLVQGIGDQLGTALANIMANEEIRDRENEKSVLLSLSNEIASVRYKEDLFAVVKTKLSKLFSVRGFAIGLISEDGQTHSVFITDIEEEFKAYAGFREILQKHYPVSDYVFSRIIQSEDPVLFLVDELPSADLLPEYAASWKKWGIELLVGSPLRVGKENLGCLYFHLDRSLLEEIESQKNLLRGVCAQISTALSNMISYEKIGNQLSEIRQYKEQLEEENQYLQGEVSSGYTYSDIVGVCAPMKKVFHLLSQVAFANSTVLILGETGTGKELIARAIHNSSSRSEKLMVKVNCAVLPPNLIESELFGHEKGSFTGATERRIGKFELANNGTLFLDEIGEMPLDLQVKLLRAIQEREIERIGGKSTIKINVRLIAATNRPLHQEVEKGRFRQDLYYRLNVFPITLPPLRERKEDIPALVSHFMDRFAKNTGKKIKHISGKAMKELMAYSWPGNVRELEHLMERSVLMTPGNTIREVHLPVNNKDEIKKRLEDEYLKTHEENERDHIIRVLNKCNGKIYGPGGAAAILQLKVSTLNSKIRKLGIRKNKTYS